MPNEGFNPIENYGLEPEEYERRELEALMPVDDEDGGPDWLAVATDAYETSDDFFSSSLRKQVEKNIDMFNSRHQAGSKYNQPSYKYRSKIYRPKSRSAIRRHEAAAATAYFSTGDVVSCQAVNQKSDLALAGALIGENLMNARLADPEMKWFQTCMGAYQDAMVQGAVASRQGWEYKEIRYQQELDNGMLTIDEFGDPILQDVIEIVKDRPKVNLIPLENLRFDPASDWRDPVESSPYLIELIPMYRQDVIDRMANPDPKTGEPPWNYIDPDQLSEGNSTGSMDSTRQKRNYGREDGKDKTHATSAFDIIWVHRNIVRMDGEDYLFYTLGTTHLLSEPTLLSDINPLGRDYVIGYCNLETHKTVPAGTIELTAGIQQEINDIANQRLDNVKLVVNRRSFVRRSANVDVRGLTQSVPGGVTLVENVNEDVKYDAPPDVTGSSYQEQDRLNMDFDELSGAFSGSSVGTNRSLNETVGGMELMQQDANSVTDYQLRVFSETWLKPVLRQLFMLEQFYETDERYLMAAANGIDDLEAITNALQSKILVELSVGFGATNPQKKVERLAFGLNTIGQYMPHMLQKLDFDEVSKEIFGALGYQDGSRFFKLEDGEDPQVAQLQQQIQELQQMLQSKQLEAQTKVQVEQIRQQGAMQREQIKAQLQKELAQLNQQIEYIDQQIAAEQNDIKRGELIVQRDAFDFSRKQKELEYAITERDRMSDILMRNQYGMAPGIDDQPGRG